LSGSVLFTMSGDGCQVDLEISGFPSEGGPWPYHSISSISVRVVFTDIQFINMPLRATIVPPQELPSH
jgi:hypothetical protein